MPARFMRIGLVAAAVVAAAGGTAVGDSPAADPTIPAISITYGVSCTFTMTVDPGLPVTATSPPGPALPPGPYQLLVFMPNPANGYDGCPGPRFSFSGPGFSGTIEFRGEELYNEQLRPVLLPSSTYVARDENAPAATSRVFTTTATGSSTSLVAPPSASSPGPAKGSVQPELVGSALPPYRGRILARVDASGKVALLRAGRKLARLPAGRYILDIDDRSRRAGLALRRGARAPMTLSAVAFVGKRSRTITLVAGSWTLVSKVGPPARFTVVR